MITKRMRFAALVRLLVFALNPHTACAAGSSNIDPVQHIGSRIDHYFSEPRSPETFRAATRWRYNRNSSPAAYSRQAFQLLHELFPDSAEAKRTPYRFN